MFLKNAALFWVFSIKRRKTGGIRADPKDWGHFLCNNKFEIWGMQYPKVFIETAE
jgi:hypothetical protein